MLPQAPILDVIQCSANPRPWLGTAVVAALALGELGCVGLPPPPPMGDGGSTDGTTLGEIDIDGQGVSTRTSSGSASTGSGSGPSDGTATVPPGDTGASSGEPSATTDRGTATLTLSDGPTYDFGLVPTGAQVSHVFVLTNEGESEALALGSMALADPFALTGPFPGAGGSCGASLAPGDACTVEVVFLPTELGPQAGTLAITHEGGAPITCDLMGGGGGQSGNLIVNPGGETYGNPPPNWLDVGAGNWLAGTPRTIDVNPVQGVGSLVAFDGPSYQDMILRQDVAVDPWTEAIDAGVLRFIFQAQARSYQPDNDSHRIRVSFRDAGGTVLSTWDTDWLGTSSWTLRTDERLAPAGTRVVRVELLCRKTAGTYCDAYFDAVELHAAYP